MPVDPSGGEHFTFGCVIATSFANNPSGLELMFHMPRLYSVAFRVILVLPPPLPPVELLLLG